jgi:hypothetical protein
LPAAYIHQQQSANRYHSENVVKLGRMRIRAVLQSIDLFDTYFGQKKQIYAETINFNWWTAAYIHQQQSASRYHSENSVKLGRIRIRAVLQSIDLFDAYLGQKKQNYTRTINFNWWTHYLLVDKL